ncbi:MAG: hypothetical protein H6738_23295 [Alphaproteobacteria bacterium]|nr:hypothetical protein [Alphaproteobacteria bacterium]MCB9699731.1 hypothetical protein [Alphaproteobacteria bacterium]
MAADVALVVLDVARGVVVVDGWLGMGRTRTRLEEVVARPPDATEDAWASWRVTPAEARAVAEASYAGGASVEQVDGWISTYGGLDFVWWATVSW